MVLAADLGQLEHLTSSRRHHFAPVIGVHRWAAGRAPGAPAPQEAPAGAVPADHGVGFDYDDGVKQATESACHAGVQGASAGAGQSFCAPHRPYRTEDRVPYADWFPPRTKSPGGAETAPSKVIEICSIGDADGVALP